MTPSGEALSEVVPDRPLLVLKGLAVAPDGGHAVAEIQEELGQPRELVRVDLHTGEVSPLHADAMTSMTTPHFLADGRLVLMSSPFLRKGTVRSMVDEGDGSLLGAVSLAGLAVGGLTVADDGTVLVSGHVDDPSADSHGIWRIDVTAPAGASERITTNAGNQPTIRPDGEAMVVEHRPVAKRLRPGAGRVRVASVTAWRGPRLVLVWCSGQQVWARSRDVVGATGTQKYTRRCLPVPVSAPVHLPVPVERHDRILHRSGRFRPDQARTGRSAPDD